MSLIELVRRMCQLTPDKEPSYRELTGGRWLLLGKINPVPKPPLGPLPFFPPEEDP